MADQVSDEIKAALAIYYVNRSLQAHGKEWNKEQDLERIFYHAKKEGWTVEASAGRFWFTKHGLICKCQFTITEKNFREGGKRNLREYSIIREILNAVRRRDEI